MSEFTDPNARQNKSGLGCTLLLLAVLMLVGLAMWMFLWGRAAPTTDTPNLPETAQPR